MGNGLMKEIAAVLEDDDPMVRLYRSAMDAYEIQYKAMQDIIAQGELIEQFETEAAIDA